MSTIRYFFVTTIAENKSGGFAVNNFNLTGESYPTMIDCIEYSKNKFPNQSKVSLIGISEMSESDYVDFSSKQP